jgi:hypothetical protein
MLKNFIKGLNKMDNIYYNMKFRIPMSDDLYNLFFYNGIQTGSSLIPGVPFNDVDIAVFCSSNFIKVFQNSASSEDKYSRNYYKIRNDKELNKASTFSKYVKLYKKKYGESTALGDVANNTKYSYVSTADPAQYIFNVLLEAEYTLYTPSSYRDSTFLSCYTYYKDLIVNLLLMDEINVFNEWKFATKCLINQSTNPDMLVKYKRIKFFEKCRKHFRKHLQQDTNLVDELCVLTP